MARLLAKDIAAAAAKASGVDPKYLGLEFDKSLKIWYWVGEAPVCIDYGCTHMQRLSDWTLERWVEDWVYEVREFEKDNKTTVNEYIASIDWEMSE